MAATAIVSLSYPKPRESLFKVISVARTDTTAFIGAVLPKTAVITGIYVIGGVASDANTSATISVGSTTSANEYMSAYDVKTAATGVGYNAGGGAVVGAALMTALTADKNVYAKYAETGTASTTGGPWYVKLEYVIPGAQETIQM